MSESLGMPPSTQMPPSAQQQSSPEDSDPTPMGRQLASHFDKTSQALKTMDNVRVGLTKLTQMGTAVTPEDVIKEAGVLVGKGSDPVQLASLMSDMPTNSGDALAAWVAMHAKQAEVTEEKIKQVHTVVRHTMGVHAIHQLVRSAVGGGKAGVGAVGLAAPQASPSLGQMTPQGNA